MSSCLIGEKYTTELTEEKNQEFQIVNACIAHLSNTGFGAA